MTVEETPRTPTLSELLAIHGDAVRRSIHVMLPGSVDKYYADENRADIKPVLKDRLATRDGQELLEVLPVIPSVPIMFPRAGGFFITLPVAKGDLVALVFSDRSLDNFLSGKGADTDPDDFRTHDLSDPYAILGGYPFKMAVTDSGIDANLVMGKEGGAQIHVSSNLVNLFEKAADDFLAKATEVMQNFTDRKTKYDAHVHGYAPGAAPLAPTTFPVTMPVPPATIPDPYPAPTEVKTEKVKAT